jgi:cation transport ATPase
MGIATRNFLHFFSALLALPVIFYSSQVFFKSAFHAIKNRYSHMDIPIAIAIFLACLVSLIEAYLKDKNKNLSNADIWFKNSIERTIYSIFYPKASQLIVL